MPKILFQKGHKINVGRIPWNKNKIMPEEYRITNSLAQQGKKLSKKTKQKMSKARQGNKHWNWQGGKRIVRKYVYIYNPYHPFATKQGYVKRSHLVIEKIIGRYLTLEEVVHHKGVHFPIGSIKNKQDDSPENLILFSNESNHQKFHHPSKLRE